MKERYKGVCKRDQIDIRDYMNRRATPPKRVTSPTLGPPPTCKQTPNNTAKTKGGTDGQKLEKE